MRRHLQQGLENKKIAVFPHRKLSFVKKTIKKKNCDKSYRHSNIYICRMPEHGFLFTCTEYKNGSILAVNLSPKLNAKFDRQK